MTGTIVNAAGIVIGAVLGLAPTRQMSPKTQFAIKGVLGVVTIWVGLKMTWSSLGGEWWMVGRQLLIVVLALTLGRITGRLLRLQKSSNRLGQYAKEKFSSTKPDSPNRLSEGFITCAVLFCLGPMAVLGSLQEGLNGPWETLGIKAVMDGLAMMAFISTFGWGAVLAVIPVVAYQGTITLLAQKAAPYLDGALLNSINATNGLLVFCVALIILELKKIELADYLPSLMFAPLLTWLLR